MSTDAARKAVEAADAQLAAWVDEHAARVAELEGLDARSGADALAAGPGRLTELGERRARLEGETAIAASAVDSARATLLDTRRAHLRAIADDHRDRADTIDAEADEHHTLTAELLRQLAEHEGCEFAPIRQWVTRTDLLRSTAAALRKRADQLDAHAARPNLTDELYTTALATAEPHGPEATARRSHAEAVRLWAQERRRVLLAARSAWIDHRAAELAKAGNPDVVGHAVGEARLEAARQHAVFEFTEARAGWSEGPYASMRGDRGDAMNAHALHALGVEVELPAEPVEAIEALAR